MVNDDPLIGHQLANFVVERVLRRGGMAQIYYGRDVKLARPVAIKVIDTRYRSNPTYGERFVRQVRAMATWRDENIVQIFYADDVEGLYYYVMEYVDGMDLSQLILEYGKNGELIPYEDVIHLGRAIANALDYAHAKGIIHRDIKPSNVMAATDGRVLLTDFGLSLWVDEGSQGEVFGTPHYISPEQARRSADAVPQSDLYSLGVVLYEMLTGQVPFDDPSPTTLALQHITEPPPLPRQLNPYLNTETEAVLLKALCKTAQERYPTGVALMDALETALKLAASEDDDLPDLPPVPAGIQSPMASTASRLSRMSVVERIALELGKSSKPTPKPIPAPSRRRQIWLGVGSLLILFLILGLTIPNLGIFRSLWATTPSPTPTLELVLLISSPTVTAVPSFTPTPTPQPTATFLPTLTSTVPTPLPTELPPVPTIEATDMVEPTVPAGVSLRLFYDETGLYLWNPNDQIVQVGTMAFEALNSQDEPLGFTFQGREWAFFYPRLDPLACNVLERAGFTNGLPPFQCNDYNASIVLFGDDPRIFWTGNGIYSFRIYWNGQPIEPLCYVVATTCEFVISP